MPGSVQTNHPPVQQLPKESTLDRESADADHASRLHVHLQMMFESSVDPAVAIDIWELALYAGVPAGCTHTSAANHAKHDILCRVSSCCRPAQVCRTPPPQISPGLTGQLNGSCASVLACFVKGGGEEAGPKALGASITNS